ncbi:MAG TPA: sialidase family protein, partial [Bacteroidia bacterium]
FLIILLSSVCILPMWQCKSKRANSKHKITIDPNDSGAWVAIGPFGSPLPLAAIGQYSPHGTGRFMCVDVHPDRPEEIIAGHASAGIFKTLDGGKHWENIVLPGNMATGINGIIRFQNNKKHLIASTGMDLGISKQYGYGLIESFDGGNTWKRNSLRFDPQEYQLEQTRDLAILDKKKEKNLICISDHSVYLSDDGANTWTKTFTSELKFRELIVDKVRPAQIIIGGSCLLFSKDTGRTWKDLTPLICAAFGGTVNPYSRYSAVFSAKSPGKVYVVAMNNRVRYLSFETSKEDEMHLLNGGRIEFNTSRLKMGIVHNKSKGSETILIGSTRLYKSVDGLNSTTECTNPINGNASHAHDDINQILTTENDEVYICTDGGIDKGNANACRWSSLTDASKDLNASLLFGFDLAGKNNLMLGTQDLGMFHCKEGKWLSSSPYGDGGRVCNTGDSLHFFSGFAKGIAITEDGGKSYNLSGMNEEAKFHDFRIHYQAKDKTTFVAYKNLYKKEKNKYFEILTSQINSEKSIKALWINPNNSNEIWFAREDPYWENAADKLYYTKDGGLNWEDRTSTLPILKWRGITDIAINKKGTMAIALEAFDKLNSDLNKIYFSDDQGRSFYNSSKGLPNLPVNCIAAFSDQWYCGTNDGVYVYNKTMGWKKLGKGFPNVPVTELKVDKVNTALYASTFGRGMWKIKIN